MFTNNCERTPYWPTAEPPAATAEPPATTAEPPAATDDPPAATAETAAFRQRLCGNLPRRGGG